MSLSMIGVSRSRPRRAAARQRDGGAVPPGRGQLRLAIAAIAVSVLIMIVAAAARASWMSPPLRMPAAGPPWQLSWLHLSQAEATVALWAAALLGGCGVWIGLVAVGRGATVSLRVIALAAIVVIALLTVLPPAGSTDTLDYAAFGRMVVLGHSPYVMTPHQLIKLHDPISRSVPLEWSNKVSPYGPVATGQQWLAAVLGGTSAARIVFWLKLCNAVAFALVAFVADVLLRGEPKARLRVHLLWTLNPLMLWSVIAAGHLDVLAATAGLLGLLVASGWPATGKAGTCTPGLAAAALPGLGRALAAGALLGVAADIKITYALFGLAAAWTVRRSFPALMGVTLGAAAIVAPTYAWFGTPAVKAVLVRTNKTTADNFYQLFRLPPGGLIAANIALTAALVALVLALLAAARMPAAHERWPVIRLALALSVAWLFVWPYQLPSYDVMIVCLLLLFPASRLDWLVLARLTAGTVALMPGNPWPPPGHLLAAIAHVSQVAVVPVILLAAALLLVWLCVTRRWGLAGRTERGRSAPPQLPAPRTPLAR